MTKILPLVKPASKELPPVYIWQCSCGNQKFWIYEDQSVQCTECETYSSNIKAFYD